MFAAFIVLTGALLSQQRASARLPIKFMVVRAAAFHPQITACAVIVRVQMYGFGMMRVVEESLIMQIGDFGRRGLFNQSEVARLLAVKAADMDPDFIISVGDNMYPSGFWLAFHRKIHAIRVAKHLQLDQLLKIGAGTCIDGRPGFGMFRVQVTALHNHALWKLEACHEGIVALAPLHEGRHSCVSAAVLCRRPEQRR